VTRPPGRLTTADHDTNSGVQTHRWQIGAVTVTAVVELHWPMRVEWMVAEASAEALRALPWVVDDGFATPDGEMTIAVQMFVVESQGRRIVVDTCGGNHKARTGIASLFHDLHTDLPDRVAAAGFPFATIDTVVCTHLHFDHVGWNTTLDGDRWVPSFGSARYLFSAADLAHWARRDDPHHAAAFDDSVQPVLDAGLVVAFEPPHDLTSEVRLEPTPGHTPGHTSVWIRSGGHEAVITGDMVHHPVQLVRPDWHDVADSDHDVAARTRAAFAVSVVGTGTLVLGTHFPAPTSVEVLAGDGDLRVAPVLG
jgi:glyoxylase-like metal-dependent hydrolase (beta-lactamase superfamily II)